MYYNIKMLCLKNANIHLQTSTQLKWACTHTHRQTCISMYICTCGTDTSCFSRVRAGNVGKTKKASEVSVCEQMSKTIAIPDRPISMPIIECIQERARF